MNYKFKSIGLIEELCHYENSNDFIDVTENFAQEDVEDFLEEAERDHKEVLNHKDFFKVYILFLIHLKIRDFMS